MQSMEIVVLHRDRQPVVEYGDLPVRQEKYERERIMNRLQQCFAMGALVIAVWVVGATVSNAQQFPHSVASFALLIRSNPSAEVCVAPGVPRDSAALCVAPVVTFGCTQSNGAGLQTGQPSLKRALLSTTPARRADSCFAPRSRSAMRAKIIRPLFVVSSF